MNKLKRILTAAGLLALLAVSWLVALNQKSDGTKQQELLDVADAYLEDEVYILAVPYLEEAIQYDTAKTAQTETLLKSVYLKLAGQDDYTQRYTNLLDQEMARADADEAVFEEAFDYYKEQSQLKQALEIVKTGISKTGSKKLEDLYESNRYEYTVGYDYYDDVTEIYNGAVIVEKENKWGLVAANGGSGVLPCSYQKMSNYSNSRVIIQDGDEITAIDMNGNRLALLHQDAKEFGDFGESVIMLKLDDGWHMAGSSFVTILPTAYEELRMLNGGAAAAKQDGKWGLVNTSEEWVLDPKYDEILCDTLGRSYARSRVFVRENDAVKMLAYSSDGFTQIGEEFDDAKPFLDLYAAVEKDGKWGFVDTDGTLVIDYQFEDAKSFGQHLAAVKQDGKWGYIDRKGTIVIPCIYEDADCFQDGHAFVKTEAGWVEISLVEYS